MRIVLLVISVLLLCVPVNAQTWWVGPGDTVKIPLVLYDSINNPAAVDSAADSVLIRVIKNFAANSSGADTCYLHRGLLDASTNTLLHTTGNATTTLGFGQTPKRVQTFSFFATAYTLTNSATASGTYTIEVFTYDHSLNLITTRFYSLNYIYVAANTNTFAHWADSMIRAPRQLDSATSKVGIGDNAIGSTEIAVSANQEIDSGVWHSRVDTVTPDSSAGKVLYKAKAIKDTTSTRLDVTLSTRGTSTFAAGGNVNVNSITDGTIATADFASGATVPRVTLVDSSHKVGVGDNGIGSASINADAIGSSELAATAVSEIWNHRIDTIAGDSTAGKVLYKAKVIKDTTSTRLDVTLSSRGTSNLVVSDNIGVNFSDISGTLDSTEVGEGSYQQIAKRILLDTTKRVKFSNDSVVAIDPVRTVAATVAGSVGGVSGVTFPSVVPSVKQIRDTLVQSTDTGRIRVDNQGYLFAGNVMQDTTKRVPMKGGAGTDSVRSASFSVSTSVSTADKQDISRIMLGDTTKRIFSGLFSDTSKRVGFKGGSGDSVKVVGNIVVAVDSASIARSVWDNDITVQANRTVTATMTFDTTLLDKARDTVNAIIDTLQNLSSTLRLAGSDLDTVYQVVQCDDTMDGDFLLTLSDYRAQIKHKMGIGQTNTTWLTDSVLNQLVREAIVTVNPIMRGYKTSITRVTQFDSSDYPIDSLVGISSVVWHKDDTARSITYLAREKWATLVSQHTYGAGDPYLERPQVYDYTDATISFFPVPTSEDTIQINGWAKIPNITVISAVSQIPQKYRVAVLKYASFLVARSKQHPLVQTFLDEYHESISFLMAGQNAQTDSK